MNNNEKEEGAPVHFVLVKEEVDLVKIEPGGEPQNKGKYSLL